MGLPIKYYDTRVLTFIGNRVGRVIKVALYHLHNNNNNNNNSSFIAEASLVVYSKVVDFVVLLDSRLTIYY